MGFESDHAMCKLAALLHEAIQKLLYMLDTGWVRSDPAYSNVQKGWRGLKHTKQSYIANIETSEP